MGVLVALCRFDLRIPAVRSLKEKRHVVKTLTSSIRNKYEVAVAETGHHDLWQRAEIAVSAVATEGYHLRRVMHEVERHIGTFPAVDIIDSDLTLHAPED